MGFDLVHMHDLIHYLKNTLKLNEDFGVILHETIKEICVLVKDPKNKSFLDLLTKNMATMDKFFDDKNNRKMLFSIFDSVYNISTDANLKSLITGLMNNFNKLLDNEEFIKNLTGTLKTVRDCGNIVTCIKEYFFSNKAFWGLSASSIFFVFVAVYKFLTDTQNEITLFRLARDKTALRFQAAAALTIDTSKLKSEDRQLVDEAKEEARMVLTYIPPATMNEINMMASTCCRIEEHLNTQKISLNTIFDRVGVFTNLAFVVECLYRNIISSHIVSPEDITYSCILSQTNINDTQKKQLWKIVQDLIGYFKKSSEELFQKIASQLIYNDTKRYDQKYVMKNILQAVINGNIKILKLKYVFLRNELVIFNKAYQESNKIIDKNIGKIKSSLNNHLEFKVLSLLLKKRAFLEYSYDLFRSLSFSCAYVIRELRFSFTDSLRLFIHPVNTAYNIFDNIFHPIDTITAIRLFLNQRPLRPFGPLSLDYEEDRYNQVVIEHKEEVAYPKIQNTDSFRSITSTDFVDTPALKTQDYGLSEISCIVECHPWLSFCLFHNNHLVQLSREGIKFQEIEDWRRSKDRDCSEQLLNAFRQAMESYKSLRENGKPEDNPHDNFPNDGVYRWETKDAESSKILYIAGINDETWMNLKDVNYLDRCSKVRLNQGDNVTEVLFSANTAISTSTSTPSTFWRKAEESSHISLTSTSNTFWGQAPHPATTHCSSTNSSTKSFKSVMHNEAVCNYGSGFFYQ